MSIGSPRRLVVSSTCKPTFVQLGKGTFFFFFHVSRPVAVRNGVRCLSFVLSPVAAALPLSLSKNLLPRPSCRSCVFTISPTRSQTTGTIRIDNRTVVRWWFGKQRDSFDFAKLAKRTTIRFVSSLPVKRRRAATFHRSSRFLLFLSLSFSFPSPSGDPIGGAHIGKENGRVYRRRSTTAVREKLDESYYRKRSLPIDLSLVTPSPLPRHVRRFLRRF